jgi:serine/threonine protein kinase
MSLKQGTQLGPYEILSLIGAGGMGEVYKARDTKLGREVAIKVLPAAFAEDKERLARFEREARLLASLNHPNIATIHDLEESEGVHFLVLELVPGETLAERIKRGSIPVDEALPLFKQIAEGLEAAHEKGVIHRDMKPVNVKITPDGKAKVLDFGLAKAMAGESPDQDLSESSTLTRAATEAGILLGTAPYMSPEQARGKAVDKRTDIWAFGCCLYEALTGEKAFWGETVTDTIGKIVEREPDWHALPNATPSLIRSLLRRCLRKKANHRLHDIADARIEIEEALSAPPSPSPQSPAHPRTSGLSIPITIAAVALALAIWSFMDRRSVTTPRVTRTTVPLTAQFAAANISPQLAISSDGGIVVYCGERDGSRMLYRRPFDQFTDTPIPGTDGATSPFFSPDDRWIGFYANGEWRKVNLQGGTPITVCTLENFWSASWASDDLIYFSPGPSEIQRVSAEGGEPEVVARLDEQKGEWGHLYPDVLPTGKALMFTLGDADAIDSNSMDDCKIAAILLPSGERRTLVKGGTFARYLPGYIIYMRGGALLAAPFNERKMEVTGSPVQVVEDVMWSPGAGAAQYAVSPGGTLAYLQGAALGEEPRSLLWVDRNGKTQPITEDRLPFRYPALSPDGQNLAVSVDRKGNADIWNYELMRGTLTRLTHTGGNEHGPIWTPDGQFITYRYALGHPRIMFNIRADGTGEPERILDGELDQYTGSWSPDGKSLVFSQSHPNTRFDLWVLSRGDSEPQPVLTTPFDERLPAISPDGRWLAYESNASGRFEVYVQPFSGPGPRHLISIEGGEKPVWSRNGGELFYRNDDKMMAVPIVTDPEFTPGKPQLLFEGGFFRSERDRNYDVSSDGQRFVMIRSEGEPAPRQINVVQNWLEELKRLVPKN